MKLFRSLLLLFFAFLCVGNSYAQNETEEIKTYRKDVFLFGLARSYQDSVTFITNIEPVQQCTFYKRDHLMVGIELYTNQLSDYIKEKGHSGFICTTFYALSRKKSEKLYLKLKKKITKQKYTTIQHLGDFKYQYISPESVYRNVMISKSEDKE